LGSSTLFQAFLARLVRGRRLAGAGFAWLARRRRPPQVAACSLRDNDIVANSNRQFIRLHRRNVERGRMNFALRRRPVRLWPKKIRFTGIWLKTQLKTTD
jgi:hypothetical protein